MYKKYKYVQICTSMYQQNCSAIYYILLISARENLSSLVLFKVNDFYVKISIHGSKWYMYNKISALHKCDAMHCKIGKSELTPLNEP